MRYRKKWRLVSKIVIVLTLPIVCTAWKVSKYRAFFFFWSVFSLILTEYGKLQTRKNSIFGHFSHCWIFMIRSITYYRHRLKTGPRPGPWTWEKKDTLKNGSFRKTVHQGLKMISFVSCLMKDNVKVIHFHIKSRSLQDLIFVQISFENYSTNFYFENAEVGIKAVVNL